MDNDRFEAKTDVIATLSPLSIGIDDSRLLTYIKNLESQAKTHWDGKLSDGGKNLKARREQMFKYLMGRQLIGRDLKNYESEFLDNVIYESEGILKALATSKMPDIVVEAGGIGQQSQQELTAELLTKYLEKYTNADQNKRDMGILFKHMPVYLIAAYKYRWDGSKDKIGDVVFEVINPEHLLLDHTALSSNPDEQLFIIHYVEKTAREWGMLFPDKEDEILKHVAAAHPTMSSTKDMNDVLLAQKVKVAECWYDWIEKSENFDPKNPAFEFYSGVAWKLSEDVLLGKSKNPNWDYEGHDVTTLNGQPVSPEIMEQVLMAQMQGQPIPGLEIKKVFNNYFKYAKKPFIFMTYDQFLKGAIDETSRIEQIIPLQKSMDDVERQTDYMVKNHKGKHLWGSESGVTKKNLKDMDMNNPNVDGVMKGNPNDAHKYIQPEMPPAEMFVHIRERRDRMFAKVGAHGATRGEIQTDTATTNQIAREADFTKNDDLVNNTILFVSTEVVKARLHMMKLRFTEKHFEQMAGIEAGKYLSLRLTNDSIDDGMEVVVKASTTDKLRAERNAQAMATTGFTEPYYFMKDMGIPDPEGRAEAIMLFQTNANLWYQKVVLKKDISMMANQIVQSVGASAPAVEGQVVPPPGQQQAQPPQAPVQPSPTNTSNVATTPQGSGKKGIAGFLQKRGLIY